MSTVVCAKCGTHNTPIASNCLVCGAALARHSLLSSIPADGMASGDELSRASRRRLGKYEVLEELGVGGMAVVYRARDTLMGRWVALKLIHQQLEGGESARKRFLHEAKVAGSLSHPNIVVIHELGVEQGMPFIAMEYLDGCDLRDLIDWEVPLSHAQKVPIILQIARALVYAHSRGIIHRDVKPANIRILPDGTVKLLDFGIAKFSASNITGLTKTGSVVGSVSYMSPEQLAGEPLTPASDVFSFGIVTYELLSGTRLFQAPNPATVLHNILYKEVPPLVETGVPADLDALILRCLRKAPGDRFQTLEPAIEELERIGDRLRREAAEPSESFESVLLRHVQSRPAGAAAGGQASYPTVGTTESSERILAEIERARSDAETPVPSLLTQRLPQPTRWASRIAGLLGAFAAVAVAFIGFQFWSETKLARDEAPRSSVTPRIEEEFAAATQSIQETSTTGALPAPSPPPAATASPLVPRAVATEAPIVAEQGRQTATAHQTQRASPPVTRTPKPTSSPIRTPAEPVPTAAIAPSHSAPELVRGLRLGGALEGTIICIDGQRWNAQRIGLASILDDVAAGQREFKLIDPKQGTAKKPVEVRADGGSRVIRFAAEDWRPPQFRVQFPPSKGGAGVILAHRPRTGESVEAWIPYDPPRPLARTADGGLELVGTVGEAYRIEIQSEESVEVGVEMLEGTPDVAELRSETNRGATMSKRCVRPAQAACEDLASFSCGVLR